VHFCGKNFPSRRRRSCFSVRKTGTENRDNCSAEYKKPAQSAPLIEQEIQIQRAEAGGEGNAELARTVRLAGASNIAAATPDQFMRGLNSLIARANSRRICEYVRLAVRARPDLTDRIVTAAVNARHRWSCEEIDWVVREAIVANPAAARQIVRTAIAVAPGLRDCIQPCAVANAFLEPRILNTINPANTIPGQEVVSPEQPPSP
jgi:hypothetical protein